MGFTLHPRLAADTFAIGDLPLCRVLLLNDAQYPWFVLVPRRENTSEIFLLDDADQQQLLRESSRLSRALMDAFRGDKLNVAALGNVVPQLHVHHIVRYRDDPAWPGAVWGRYPPVPYADEVRRVRIANLRAVLPDLG
jgi:diadenosine tetraphosphate (Ap4A) HIT family hydrolase